VADHAKNSAVRIAATIQQHVGIGDRRELPLR